MKSGADTLPAARKLSFVSYGQFRCSDPRILFVGHSIPGADVTCGLAFRVRAKSVFESDIDLRYVEGRSES